MQNLQTSPLILLSFLQLYLFIAPAKSSARTILTASEAHSTACSSAEISEGVTSDNTYFTTSPPGAGRPIPILILTKLSVSMDEMTEAHPRWPPLPPLALIFNCPLSRSRSSYITTRSDGEAL